MYATFMECSGLTSLDVSKFDTRRVTNMGYMFDGCTGLTSLDVTNFDTSNVNNMRSMFGSCTDLTSLDVTNFDTSNVNNMRYMFNNCRGLTNLDVTNFNTSNVTRMENVFSGCIALTSLDVTNFDTSNVIIMFGMFNRCIGLTSIDVSRFNTNKVNSMRLMFSYCVGLTALDLSNFDMTNCSSYAATDYMLKGTPSLWQLKLGPKVDLTARMQGGLQKTVGLADPTASTAINDLANPTPVYYATNSKWREVGSGSVHEPKGPIINAENICADTASRRDTRTYVWDQIGKQTLETGSSIDFGSHQGHLRDQKYNSSAQTLRLTDNRNARSGQTWQITAALTKPFTLTTDNTKTISGSPLYYEDTTSGSITNITSTAQIIKSGTATSSYQEINEVPWTLSFEAKPSDIPAPGSYQAEVTYTLVNSTP